jgi:hypothetical protein
MKVFVRRIHIWINRTCGRIRNFDIRYGLAEGGKRVRPGLGNKYLMSLRGGFPETIRVIGAVPSPDCFGLRSPRNDWLRRG